MQYIIYGLFDPRTGELRYVGKSTRGMKRPREHTQPGVLAKTSKTYRSCWIQSLREQGLAPEIDALEVCEQREDLDEAEQWHIAYWRSLGCRLANLTSGGEGGRTLSLESRRRISAAHLGKKMSPEACAKMSQSRTGLKADPEAVERRASAMRGRQFSQEHCLSLSRGKGGKPFTDDAGNRYETLMEASRILNINSGSISEVLRGRRKTAGGRVFTYLPKESEVAN